jgi:hypothetical protein
MRNFDILVDSIHNLVPFFLSGIPERLFKFALLRCSGGRLRIFCFKRLIQCLGNGATVCFAVPNTLFSVPAEFILFQSIAYLHRRLAVKCDFQGAILGVVGNGKAMLAGGRFRFGNNLRRLFLGCSMF